MDCTHSGSLHGSPHKKPVLWLCGGIIKSTKTEINKHLKAEHTDLEQAGVALQIESIDALFGSAAKCLHADQKKKKKTPVEIAINELNSPPVGAKQPEGSK